jgi:hypothetical protein
MKQIKMILRASILSAVFMSTTSFAKADSQGLREGAETIRDRAIDLFTSAEGFMETKGSVLPVLASAILALEQTIDRAEAADKHLADHEDDLFLLEFTKACSKIAIARGRLYRAKLMLLKAPSSNLIPEDFSELHDDIIALRDDVDCPS